MWRCVHSIYAADYYYDLRAYRHEEIAHALDAYVLPFVNNRKWIITSYYFLHAWDNARYKL